MASDFLDLGRAIKNCNRKEHNWVCILIQNSWIYEQKYYSCSTFKWAPVCKKKVSFSLEWTMISIRAFPLGILGFSIDKSTSKEPIDLLQ